MNSEKATGGVLFGAAIFFGALLVFQVQPIMAKFILPWFGGSSMVWTTCLLFFQVFLLAGYAYAHLLSKYLQPKSQAIVHSGLVAAALFVLPIIPPDSWKPVGVANPSLHILGLLTVCLGFPYLLLSATGPLMQRWFHLINPDVSPYRYYALSNAGSLIGLLSFPLFLEPLFSRKVLAISWSSMVGLFAVICILCSWVLWRFGKKEPPVEIREEQPAASRSSLLRKKFLWISFPATASILLLAVTNKLTQDVAVVPLLWVAPLTLYLLSFIICFDSPKVYSRTFFGIAFLVSLLEIVLILLLRVTMPVVLSLSVYLIGLFMACMVCHGELVRLKPEPRLLTSFYLHIAFGGALGGFFVAVIAPLIFNDYLEFQIGFLVCGLLILFMLYTDPSGRFFQGKPRWGWALLIASALVVTFLFYRERSVRNQATIDATRNFYGTLTISEYGADEPVYLRRAMLHGRIIHGLQFLSDKYRHIATAYYTAKSGIGMCIRYFPRQGGRHIGVVGLGVGTLAAWAEPEDRMRFYEINPSVRELAEKYFKYLEDCKASQVFVLGDARLSLESESPQEFDMLILDAFNSDSPPTHLLTREAFDIYRRHLKAGGVIAVNVTSRHINYLPIVVQLADHIGFRWLYIPYLKPEDEFYGAPSKWVLITNNEQLINQPEIQQASYHSDIEKNVNMWTDDYTSLYTVLQW